MDGCQWQLMEATESGNYEIFLLLVCLSNMLGKGNELSLSLYIGQLSNGHLPFLGINCIIIMSHIENKC